MNTSFLRRSLMAAVLAASTFGAQAALVLAGSGNTVDFYYDNAFWSGKTATVSGDSISFSGGSALRADGSNGGIASVEAAPGSAGLVVVAKNGFSFSNAPFSFVSDLAGSYRSTAGGIVTAFSSATVGYGSFAGGAFTQDGTLGSTSADAAAFDAASGAYASTQYALESLALSGGALALFDVAYSVFAFGDDSAFSQIESLLYAVSAAPVVSAVPEPGTLALLAAALGVAGLVRRRNTRA